MTESPAAVSIVICAYTMDRWEDIREAVESARGQKPPAEIIVVIDHNSELETRARAAFPDAAVIPNREEQGLSGARNSGVAAARGKFIAFLDDDAIADQNWAADLAAECEKPGIAGAVSKVIPLWIGQRPRWFPDEFLWVVGCSYRGLPYQRREIRNVIGGGCCLTRELFEIAGGFSSLLGRKKGEVPISCEETELCIRARQVMGDVRFVLQPSAFIYHKVPAKRLTWSYFTLRCYAEGLSKAYMAGLVGTDLGLSSERTYALRTLPAGVLRGLGDAVLRFDRGGLQRAAAIVWGLGCATVGYAKGRVSFRSSLQPRRPALARGDTVRETYRAAG